jgi:PilZ domain-containing protein
MDHRWGRRVRVDFPVRVAAHRFAVRDGRLIDLSVSGALIEADLDARVLSRIQVVLLLPDYPRHEAPAVEAYVARKHRHGIGVEWCEFAPRAVRELLRETVRGSFALYERSRRTEFEVRNRPDA